MNLISKIQAAAHNLGTLEPIGEKLTPNAEPISQMENILSAVIGLLTIIGGIYFAFQIITATYKWMNTGGDKAKLQQAQQKLVDAVTGLIFGLGAYAIILLISYVLGFDLFNLEETLGNLWP